MTDQNKLMAQRLGMVQQQVDELARARRQPRGRAPTRNRASSPEPERPLRHARRRRGVRRRGHGGAPRDAAAASACWWSTAATTSRATPTTTSTSTACSSTLRAAHLPHELREGRRLPLAVHRVAALRAPRARRGRRAAGADPDQPDDDQRAVRAGPAHGGGGRGVLRGARASTIELHPRPPRTPSWRRSAATCTRSSSAATRASSGSATPASCTPRSARGSRRARTPTTATSRTATRRCRPTATPRCSSGCSTTRTSTSGCDDFDDVRDEVEYGAPRLHRPDRRLLRPPLRPAALPLASSSSCATSRRPTAGCCFQPRLGQLPGGRRALHADDRVPPPDRAGARPLDARASSTRAPRATRTTRSPATRPARSTSATRRWPRELPT